MYDAKQQAKNFQKLDFEWKRKEVLEMLSLMKKVPLAKSLHESISAGDVQEHTLDYLHQTINSIVKDKEQEDFDKNANQKKPLNKLKNKLSK